MAAPTNHRGSRRRSSPKKRSFGTTDEKGSRKRPAQRSRGAPLVKARVPELLTSRSTACRPQGPLIPVAKAIQREMMRLCVHHSSTSKLLDHEAPAKADGRTVWLPRWPTDA